MTTTKMETERREVHAEIDKDFFLLFVLDGVKTRQDDDDDDEAGWARRQRTIYSDYDR